MFFGWGAHLTHHEREQVKERIAAGIGIALALIVAALLVNGWYQENIAKPGRVEAARNKPVARVGGPQGAPITHAFYHRILAFEEKSASSRYTSLKQEYDSLNASTKPADKAKAAQLKTQLDQLQQQYTQVPQQIYQQLIDYKTIDLKAASAGLHLSSTAIDNYVRNVVWNQIGGQVTFLYQAKADNLSPDELNYLIAESYKFKKLQAYLAARVQKRGLHVHVRHILVSKPQPNPSQPQSVYVAAIKKAKRQARGYLRQLEAAGCMNHPASGRCSAAWKRLGKKSGDPSSGAKGGDLGWALPGGYVPPFAKASRTMPIDTIRIVKSQFGFHVMQVLGRKVMKLTTSELSSAKASALAKWLKKVEGRKGFVKKYIKPSAASGLPPVTTNPTAPVGTIAPVTPVTTTTAPAPASPTTSRTATSGQHP